MINIKIKQNLIPIAFILALVGIATILQNHKIDKILKNPCTAIATFTGKLENGAKQHYGFYFAEYIYIVNGNGYIGEYKFSADEVSKENFNLYFLKNNFSILYSCNDYKNHYSLLLPSDFEELDIEYPDSLKWIPKLLND